MKNNTFTSLIAYLSYTVGLLAGLYLIVVVAWADMESAFYGFSRLAEAGLRGLNCPPLMTREEMGSISLRVSNATENPISPAVRVEISTPLMLQEYNEKLRLAPGETQKLEWSVGPENVDLRRFIFAKALVFSVYPLPNQETTCGIYIINLPGSGNLILFLFVATALLGMGWGLYGMGKSAASNEWAQKHVLRPMMFLAAIVALGILTSSLGGWVPSVLLLAVAVLMVFILLGTLVMSEQKRQ
jgi:cation transport ATPase